MKMSEHQLPRNKVYKSHKPINKCHNKVPQAILVEIGAEEGGNGRRNILLDAYVVSLLTGEAQYRAGTSRFSGLGSADVSIFSMEV